MRICRHNLKEEFILKIGELNMQCGECKLIDHCDEPFSDIKICCEDRFKEVDENRFLQLIETSKRKSKKARINDVYKRLKSIDKNIKECPYCGSEEYYIKQSFTGTCNFRIRFDGKQTDNGDMHDNTLYKNTSKFVYCNDCNKKLFEIEN